VERYLRLVEDMEESLHRGEEMVFRLGPIRVCVDVEFFHRIKRVTPGPAPSSPPAPGGAPGARQP